jgi:hypothetical protein
MVSNDGQATRTGRRKNYRDSVTGKKTSERTAEGNGEVGREERLREDEMKVKKEGDGKIKYADINLASPEGRNNALETARDDATHVITWRVSFFFVLLRGPERRENFPHPGRPAPQPFGHQ